MSTTRQPTPSLPPKKNRRRAHALDEPKAKTALRAGLVGTVLIHVVLVVVLLSLPDDILDVPDMAAAPNPNRAFEVELSSELFELAPAAPLEPPRFVEVNPAAPENPPDETPLVGAQNQQVAQPVPTPDSESDTPAVQNEDETTGSTALVRGNQNEPQPPPASEQLAQLFTPPTPPSLVPEREQAPAEQAPAQAVNAPGGGEQLLGEADNSPGTTVTALPPTPGAETGAEPRQGTTDSRSSSGGYFAGTPAINRTQPRDRTRLSSETINARNTPTIRNELGTQNIGVLAYSARWSEYGEYLQRLIDAVQAQWERILMRSSYYPSGGSLVKVVFKLNDKGEISEIVTVEGEGGEVGKRLCVSAITERAPYGEWPEDMRSALGTEQELTFRFLYQ